MKRGVRNILLIGAMVIFAAAIYFTFIYSTSCKDISCFNSNLAQCERAKFLKESEDASWEYQIIGKKGESCKIEVKLLSIKEGLKGTEDLQGEIMNCYLPVGVVDAPEKDISKCHGPLKELLQNLIIQKLHSHILENLGTIDKELQKPI